MVGEGTLRKGHEDREEECGERGSIAEKECRGHTEEVRRRPPQRGKRSSCVHAHTQNLDEIKPMQRHENREERKRQKGREEAKAQMELIETLPT